MFHVDADDDIVVGDTIIFTERLYVDRDGDLIPALGAGGAISRPPPVISLHTFPAAASGATRSTPRVSTTMAGLGSQAIGGWATGTGPIGGGRPETATATMGYMLGTDAGEFAGERTAAAHVLQDSFRSMRRKEEGGVLEYNRWRLDWARVCCSIVVG